MAYDVNGGAKVLPGLSSGDNPLSVRARPSSPKRDYDRRPTNTRGRVTDERTRCA